MTIPVKWSYFSSLMPHSSMSKIAGGNGKIRAGVLRVALPKFIRKGDMGYLDVRAHDLNGYNGYFFQPVVTDKASVTVHIPWEELESP